MKRVALVRLKRSFRAQYFEVPASAKLKLSEPSLGLSCIVELDRVLEMGVLAGIPRFSPESEFVRTLPRILRVATDEDRMKEAGARLKEGQAMHLGAKKLEERQLPARLVKTECSLDGGRVLMYVSSESRLDVREVIRELTEQLGAQFGQPGLKVEFKQVGPRDLAAQLGGCGPCGRDLCCSTFLRDYPTVSMRMAKEQHLPMSPFKLNGMCGRLKCCIAYEWGMSEDRCEHGDSCTQEGCRG